MQYLNATDLMLQLNMLKCNNYIIQMSTLVMIHKYTQMKKKNITIMGEAIHISSDRFIIDQ